jgi:hypothetical protein
MVPKKQGYSNDHSVKHQMAHEKVKILDLLKGGISLAEVR